MTDEPRDVEEAREFLTEADEGAVVEPRHVRIARALAAADRENAELRAVIAATATEVECYVTDRLADARQENAELRASNHAMIRLIREHGDVEAERDEARTQLAAAQAQLAYVTAKLVSALERTQGNFELAVMGKPVRDMCENLAENEAAFAAALSAAPQPEPDVRAAYSESLRRLGRADLAPDDFRLADLEEFDYDVKPEPPASDEPARNRCTCDRAKEGAAFHHPTCPSYISDEPARCEHDFHATNRAGERIGWRLAGAGSSERCPAASNTPDGGS